MAKTKKTATSKKKEAKPKTKKKTVKPEPKKDLSFYMESSFEEVLHLLSQKKDKNKDSKKKK